MCKTDKIAEIHFFKFTSVSLDRFLQSLFLKNSLSSFYIYAFPAKSVLPGANVESETSPVSPRCERTNEPDDPQTARRPSSSRGCTGSPMRSNQVDDPDRA